MIRIQKLTTIFILTMTTFCFGQKEKGYVVEIMGNNFILNVNNTKWKLEKIIDGGRYRGILFKKKRKPKKDEELEISFKDGTITYNYISTGIRRNCRYKERDERTNDYEAIRIECESHSDAWVVYRLSPQKLVFSFDRLTGPLRPSNITYFGRYIFYRIY